MNDLLMIAGLIYLVISICIFIGSAIFLSDAVFKNDMWVRVRKMISKRNKFGVAQLILVALIFLPAVGTGVLFGLGCTIIIMAGAYIYELGLKKDLKKDDVEKDREE